MLAELAVQHTIVIHRFINRFIGNNIDSIVIWFKKEASTKGKQGCGENNHFVRHMTGYGKLLHGLSSTS